MLERDQVIRIILHPGEPIDDKFVGLFVTQTKFGKDGFQKGFCFAAGNDKTGGEVIIYIGLALPEQAVIFPAIGIGEGAVWLRSDGPAVFVGGIGGSQFAVEVQFYGNFSFFFIFVPPLIVCLFRRINY